MGLFSAITKGAVAKRVIDEGRKPENQAKIKRAVSSLRSGKGGAGGTGGTGRR